MRSVLVLVLEGLALVLVLVLEGVVLVLVLVGLVLVLVLGGSVLVNITGYQGYESPTSVVRSDLKIIRSYILNN